VFCTLLATGGAVVIGVLKIIAGQTAAKTALKKTSEPPPSRGVDHGPCNDSVDRLTEAMHEEIQEQREFRKLFEVWMARQEGYAKGLAATGEFPVAR
jgi:hypothetical protein